MRLLNQLVNTDIDGVIIQDLGLFYLLSEYFENFCIHASTQLTTHNKGQISFLSKLNASRVNLSRELNIDEIKDLTLFGHEKDVQTEVFVHGSYCLGFSGVCYLSSFLGGNSGNRGRCSQPCRDRYFTSSEGNNYPLNLKDNSLYTDIEKLFDARVDSLKIEGRIKNFEYVYTIVDAFKKQIKKFTANGKIDSDNTDLYKVFNRDFSNGFFAGDINKDMFIDNPRDNSMKHFIEINNEAEKEKSVKGKKDFYDEKDQNIANIRDKIKQLSIAKAPLEISFSGNAGEPLKISLKMSDNSLSLTSKSKLSYSDKYTLIPDSLLKTFKAIDDTEYFIKDIEFNDLGKNLFIPFKEITLLKKRILFILNDSRELIEAIDIQKLEHKSSEIAVKPSLSVLISSPKDLHLCDKTSADIFFQLPNCSGNRYSDFIDLFLENKKVIPWFPSILLGKNYSAAVRLLKKVKPECIVANNTGIAYQAYKHGIPWVAGPYLNLVNSYSLLCLKKNFNCRGGFISNEINRNQIRRIHNLDNFKLYYSIYHPILLLTSRQCLFHQVLGCEKDSIDDECMNYCHKTASITNFKHNSLLIKKIKGNYPSLYNEINFLNTDIVSDMPIEFSCFSIDLRDMETKTKIGSDKFETIRLFENLIAGKNGSKDELEKNICPTTCIQYQKGI